MFNGSVSSCFVFLLCMSFSALFGLDNIGGDFCENNKDLFAATDSANSCFDNKPISKSHKVEQETIDTRLRHIFVLRDFLSPKRKEIGFGYPNNRNISGKLDVEAMSPVLDNILAMGQTFVDNSDVENFNNIISVLESINDALCTEGDYETYVFKFTEPSLCPDYQSFAIKVQNNANIRLKKLQQYYDLRKMSDETTQAITKINDNGDYNGQPYQ